LEMKMPGYRSYLHRHEWYKHGVCAGYKNAEEYYRVSLDMLDQLNASSLTKYVAGNIGREFNLRKLAGLMADSFGKPASVRVAMDCNRDGNRTLLSELRISVRPDVVGNLKGWILAAPRLRSGCKSGIIDPVGLQ